MNKLSTNPDAVALEIRLGSRGMGSETRIFLAGIEVTSQVRGYRLRHDACSLAQLELDVLPKHESVVRGELAPHGVQLLGVPAAVEAAVVSLAPWLQHHPACARITEAGDCSCGLSAKVGYLRGREG